jgi:hypothetical protein
MAQEEVARSAIKELNSRVVGDKIVLIHSRSEATNPFIDCSKSITSIYSLADSTSLKGHFKLFREVSKIIYHRPAIDQQQFRVQYLVIQQTHKRTTRTEHSSEQTNTGFNWRFY